MSLEIFGNIDTAQELFEFLQKIPQAQRERLPLMIAVNNDDVTGNIAVDAFEVTETEGCIERGFRLTNES